MRTLPILAFAAAVAVASAATARAQTAPAPAAPPAVALSLQEVDGLIAVLGEAPARISAQALLFLAARRQQAIAAEPAPQPKAP